MKWFDIFDQNRFDLNYKLKILKTYSLLLNLNKIEKPILHNILYEKYTLLYLKKYRNVIKKNEINYKYIDSDKEIVPSIIWQLWTQGIDEAPPIVKASINSVRKHMNDFQINLISDKNIHNYIDLPGYIYDKKKKGNITNVNFSDILRASLLAEHGGIWLDSTVFLTEKLLIQNKIPFFHFSTTPSHLLGYSNIIGSSWYISSSPNNTLISLIRDLMFEFWKFEKKVIHHYYFHLMLRFAVSENKNCEDIINQVPFVSNIPPQVLQMELFKKFDLNRFEQIKKMSNIHKLSYYYDKDIIKSTEKTFYEFIVNLY